MVNAKQGHKGSFGEPKMSSFADQKPRFFRILTTLRSKTPSLASCNKLTNFVVNKPRDFSCLLGVPGEPKSAMIAELHAAKIPCVDMIG